MEQNFFLHAITLYDVKKHILNDNVYEGLLLETKFENFNYFQVESCYIYDKRMISIEIFVVRAITH